MPVIFDSVLPYKTRCQLPDCGRPINHVFRTDLQGMTHFCSGEHAREGVRRWEEKIKLGVRMGVPAPKDIAEEYVGDSIPGSGGEDNI